MELLQRGLVQRVKALNAFIHDVYHEREILHAGRVPPALILHNDGFRPEMQGFSPPQSVYAHISGIDMVRVGPDRISTCSKTIAARRRASPTCSKIAKR